jgi:hypothetical protein
LNLYQPTQPQVLGLPGDFIHRGEFEWAAVAHSDNADPENPWQALHAKLGRDDSDRPIVPVVLDASTAIYSLHLKGVGATFTVRDAAGERRKLLANVSGYRRLSILSH